MHGKNCRVIGCAQHDGRMKTAPLQRAFYHALRPYQQLLTRRGSTTADAERQRITVRLDFVAGQFQVGALPFKAVRVRLCGQATLGSPQTAPQNRRQRMKVQTTTPTVPEVVARLELRAGSVCLHLRVSGCVALDFGTPHIRHRHRHRRCLRRCLRRRRHELGSTPRILRAPSEAPL